MGLNNHALWQVATKALLFNGEGKLLALTTPDGYLDFPGGRVDETERQQPWTESLKREVGEELGPSITFEPQNIAFVSKRSYHHDGTTHYIAAIYFTARYIGGDIELSDEHAQYAWIDPKTILTSNYTFVSDDERQQLQAYFGD